MERSEAVLGRRILDGIRYMTLATAGPTGRPWATPVWFAHHGYTELWWVSRPGARHSQNLAVRPEAGIVVFDSTVPISTGQGVYVEAVAAEADEADLAHGLAVYSRQAEAEGGRAWGPDDVTGEARLRLYRAQVVEAFVLSPKDERVPVNLASE
ncbi:pyridoxamine 5'-phosphate oxidase family protein [Glycomyces sp. NPDC047369]